MATAAVAGQNEPSSRCSSQARPATTGGKHGRPLPSLLSPSSSSRALEQGTLVWVRLPPDAATAAATLTDATVADASPRSRAQAGFSGVRVSGLKVMRDEEEENRESREGRRRGSGVRESEAGKTTKPPPPLFTFIFFLFLLFYY